MPLPVRRTTVTPRPATTLVPASEQFDLPLTTPQRLHLMPHGPWDAADGGVCAPLGFAAQGLYAGLRQDSRRADVALLASDRPSAAAGCMGDTAAAVLMVVAEAGKQGAPAGGAEAMRACRDEVGAALGVDPALVEVQACGGGGGGGGSTSGLDRVLAAVPLLAERLDGGAEASHHAACAACGEGSWDTATKEAALEVPLGRGGSAVRLGGMAHASPGGIQGTVTCDAQVDPATWRAMFDRAAAATFGQVALAAAPGAASPHGGLVGLASGAAHNTPLIRDGGSPAGQRLEGALTALMEGLAKAVASDARGTRCLIEVEVSGADSEAAARRAALAVASSGGMRAAVGRCSPEVSQPIVAALGASGVLLDPAGLRICLGGMPLLHHGKPTPSLPSAAGYCAEYLHLAAGRQSQVRIDVKLGRGVHTARAWAPDRS
ncbi:hypothetical protein CHLNCDRAFT_144765 [Chlorella variabilis]|uniref:Uncharacterized protein n=1 Tax=Chlorella variabilis TaxID=554065 RepID=E1ZCZ0_CHLVA|nr:hypothetical protein CHLNCDRAFT_144765 [Chlorella variabilis]EFN56323.1 hypothetical protein CHLNCDRAFT_144765 [Chlorella variabilis]|eukprot:XP_005848425.1 hypothetical protein CHLNCDRAFT_144765 [Chlorella variabilis]